MRKLLAILVITIVALLIGFLGYKILRIREKKEMIASAIVSLPPFSFYKLDNTVFNRDSVANDKRRLIIMLFSPDCDHCQYMAKSYVLHKQQFDSVRILMVTIADSPSTAKFYTDYRLNTMPGITMLRDPKMTFPGTFGAGMIPTFLIYKNGKLINKFIGETKVDNLLIDSTLTVK
ncbi:MAG TPA: thioredoxin family protein [Puia sp.]|nr:thioredoxin family protein [Puia sp.]